MTQELKRVNTFDGSDKDKKSEFKVGQADSKMSKSFEEGKGVVNPLKVIPKLEISELYKYEDELDSYRIKVTNSKG